MNIKNFFNHFRFVRYTRYKELEEQCVGLYRETLMECDKIIREQAQTISKCKEENHRLQDEVRKLHDNLMVERNRKPRPIIVKKECCYSLYLPNQYIETLKNQAKEELLHDVETFIHEEEMGSGRVRFSIALFPIEDKRFM